MVTNCHDGGVHMSLMGEILSTLFERRYKANKAARSDTARIENLCRELLSSRGEVTGFTLACRILDKYSAFDDNEKLAFFQFLNDDMDIDIVQVAQTLEAYRSDHSITNYKHFMKQAEPARQELARRLNQVPGATAQLVGMRKDLLSFLRKDHSLERVDIDFRHLFVSWFNRGFLVLRPINWNSPAHILEKIIAYEAVHAIDSWDDLRRRLEPEDRRCFGFFHPAMPDEPLIFVEVALTKGIPNSIQELLKSERMPLATEDADTAVFYSISNCQTGLSGVSFGNSLIKQVVGDLANELSQLRTFVTLSPIPNLAKWAREQGTDIAAQEAETLQSFAAHYLINAKRSKGQAYDPVAGFHLNNGAFIHDVHVEADVSQKGLRQSGGAMVNYRYDLSQISANHEAYAAQNKVIASAKVQQLARRLPADNSVGA